MYTIISICCFFLISEALYTPVPQIMSRIIDGRESDIRNHPYQVALVTNDGFEKKIVCGGALVKPRVVFTAAHCTHIDDDVPRANLTVLVGANSLSDPKGRNHGIEKVVKHPKFTYDVFDNDFAAVVLKRPVKYDDRVQPIKIAERDYEGGVKGVVTGWGLTESGKPSENLRSVKLELEDWGKCQDHFPKPFHPTITKNHICVKPDTKTTTYGDSGSPLVVDGKLIGLVSFGRMVDEKRKATVFSRVKSFLDIFENEHHFKNFK